MNEAAPVNSDEAVQMVSTGNFVPNWSWSQKVNLEWAVLEMGRRDDLESDPDVSCASKLDGLLPSTGMLSVPMTLSLGAFGREKKVVVHHVGVDVEVACVVEWDAVVEVWQVVACSVVSCGCPVSSMAHEVDVCTCCLPEAVEKSRVVGETVLGDSVLVCCCCYGCSYVSWDSWCEVEVVELVSAKASGSSLGAVSCALLAESYVVYVSLLCVFVLSDSAWYLKACEVMVWSVGGEVVSEVETWWQHLDSKSGFVHECEEGSDCSGSAVGAMSLSRNCNWKGTVEVEGVCDVVWSDVTEARCDSACEVLVVWVQSVNSSDYLFVLGLDCEQVEKSVDVGESGLSDHSVACEESRDSDSEEVVRCVEARGVHEVSVCHVAEDECRK